MRMQRLDTVRPHVWTVIQVQRARDQRRARRIGLEHRGCSGQRQLPCALLVLVELGQPC